MNYLLLTREYDTGKVHPFSSDFVSIHFGCPADKIHESDKSYCGTYSLTQVPEESLCSVHRSIMLRK